MKEIELTVPGLNTLKKSFGERVKVKGQSITILRVPGGYLYEYYSQESRIVLDDGHLNTGNIVGVVFVSTDELRNE